MFVEAIVSTDGITEKFELEAELEVEVEDNIEVTMVFVEAVSEADEPPIMLLMVVGCIAASTLEVWHSTSVQVTV